MTFAFHHVVQERAFQKAKQAISIYFKGPQFFSTYGSYHAYIYIRAICQKP